MGMDKKIQKKSWIRRNLVYLILGVLLLVFVFYNFISYDDSSTLNVVKDKVSIATVKNEEFKDYIAVTGTVEPIQTIYLDATEGGRVEKIFIEEGTKVKEGDAILLLSNDKLMLEISNNEAQVERAINDLEQARMNLQNQDINNKNRLNELYYGLFQLKRDFKNNETLFKGGYISEEELSISRESYKKNSNEYKLLKEKTIQDSVFRLHRISSSKKSINNMYENLDLARKRLEKLTLKSSVNGELASLNPKVGEVINYGIRIGSINILDSYKLKVDIDEFYIARVYKGFKGNCDFSGKNYLAKISKIYPEVIEGKFSVDMTFEVERPEDIRIGQTTRIGLELGESKEALLIPNGGFYQSTGGQWVYVIDSSGTYAIKRNIKIGRRNPKYYEVLEGLEKGERIITSSYDSFGKVDKIMLK